MTPTPAWSRWLLELLWPPRCAACRRRGDWLCADCHGRLVPPPVPGCRRCGDGLARPGLCRRCRQSPPAFDQARAAYAYRGPLRRAIQVFKYDGQRVLAEPLAGLVLPLTTDLAPVDLIVAVPLHPTRQRQRGYNQSELLARAIAAYHGWPLTTALIRRWSTPPQVGLRGAARRANVVAAFDWTGPDLAGHHLVLIDDVATTGATLDACAQALRRHGAARITALTIARG